MAVAKCDDYSTFRGTMTLSITTLSIKCIFEKLSINNIHHNDNLHNSTSAIMMNVIMLCVTIYLLLYWVLLCWVLFWVSLCWVPYCWVSLCWLSLCWVSLCWASLCWVSWRPFRCSGMHFHVPEQWFHTSLLEIFDRNVIYSVKVLWHLPILKTYFFSTYCQHKISLSVFHWHFFSLAWYLLSWTESIQWPIL
jgi:hypothetical protein